VSVGLPVAATDGLGLAVAVGAGEPDARGVGEADEPTTAGVNTGATEGDGEGVAPALQPPRSASEATPMASLGATSYQRIASHLRDALAPAIALRCRE
jgi:hypothetical protein